MVTNNPGAPSGHRASPISSNDAHWQRMEEFREANKLKVPDFVMTPYGPDRNEIWTTYLAYIGGEKLVSLPRGYWPDRGYYDTTFIGPLPPNNRWYVSWEKRHQKSGFYFLTNYMILPDAAEVVEWIRDNIKSRVQLVYTWHEKSRWRRFESRLYTYDTKGDEKTNKRFLRMVGTCFEWLDDGDAFSVGFHFDDVDEGGAFKRRYPWRYKE